MHEFIFQTVIVSLFFLVLISIQFKVHIKFFLTFYEHFIKFIVSPLEVLNLLSIMVKSSLESI